MIVGYMRNFRKPPFSVTFTATIAKAKGIDLLYFNSKGVDIENNTINGVIFKNNKWKKIETSIPPLIDVSAFCLKHKTVINHLKEHAYLTEDGNKRISKEQLQEVFAADDYYKKYVIPSAYCSSFSVVDDFLSNYDEVVIKPVFSRKGAGIYKVTKKSSDNYIIGHNQLQKEATYEELKAFYNDKIADKRHVIQKFIVSKTPLGHPFDCRVHLEKNGEGKWEIARKHFRIGIGQKVISNTSQGGGVIEVDVFLKENFPDTVDEMIEKLDTAGIEIASKIEEIRETELSTMGLDVGIDKEGNLYLFEANSAPGSGLMLAEVHTLKIDYFKFLLENRI